MLIPHHLNPPISEKDIQGYTPLHLGYWLPLAITKTHPFPGFRGKSSRDEGQKIPPFPEKMGTHMRPPFAFEWGGGGPGRYKWHLSSERVSNNNSSKNIVLQHTQIPYHDLVIPWTTNCVHHGAKIHYGTKLTRDPSLTCKNFLNFINALIFLVSTLKSMTWAV